MGSCTDPYNCTVRSNIINADADITGIGVLAAFFATAVATVAAIYLGYLSNSLSESYLNDLDRAVITAYQKFEFSKSVGGWLCGSKHLTWRLKKLFGSEKTSGARPSAPRGVRQEALTRFMLVLSDQQLVTGLAILIGAVSNQCKITGFEFSVVLSLAWFSSTTHLATLDVLRDYFALHRTIRNWRVGGMLALLLLLVYAFIVNTYLTGRSVFPVQCYLEGIPDIIPAYARGGISIASIIPGLTLLLLLSGYVQRIRNLYGSPNAIYWQAWKIGIRRSRRGRPRLSHTQERDAFGEAIARYQATSRSRMLQQIRETSGWKHWYLISFYRYRDSFLSSMPDIAFSFTYGTSQLMISRSVYPTEMTPQSSAMDFGQITPLFLLALPIFAAAEIFYDHPEENPSKSRLSSDILQSDGAAAGFPEGGPHDRAVDVDSKSLPFHGHTKNSFSQSLTLSRCAYDENLLAIKKYFYEDTEYICREEAVVATREELRQVLKYKDSLLSQFKEIQAYDQQIDLCPSMALFSVNMISSITLGISLNIDHVTVALLTIVLLLIKFTLFLKVDCSEVYRCSSALLKASRERAS